MLNKAVIDLNLLVKNALEIKSKLNKGVKFCAVVKADAYGHGAGVVANALYPYVDCFAVALLEEAVTLRNAGIDKEILCLTPFFESETERAVAYNITATVCDAKQVLALSATAKKLGKIAHLHIKFNAGMNRLGVDLKTLAELLALIKGCENLQLGGMYAHFSAPENKKSLKTQLNLFLLANNLVKGYNNNAICHISASGGFLSGVQADMARIGILLYGYKPFESDLVSVKPIMRVYAPVLTERKVEKGQTVLYGNHTLIADDCFSLLRYGYADGLFRKQIDGQINNRCMDITAVKGCKKGVWQPVMINADDIAKKYDTISYEVLTKCALRAEKIYVR
jgi:alanine racemase